MKRTRYITSFISIIGMLLCVIACKVRNDHIVTDPGPYVVEMGADTVFNIIGRELHEIDSFPYDSISIDYIEWCFYFH